MRLEQLVGHHQCIAIVGMEKNAGKTTVLNYLLQQFKGRRIAITSIGFDGEETDQVTGTAKPRIAVEKGTLVATAAGLLNRCDLTREILKLTGLHTAMGEVVIIRARSDGYVQLAGPAITSQMEKLHQMLNSFHPEKVFIDGAAARKSSAAISTADACILATGAAFSPSLTQVVEETAFSASLLNLPLTLDSQALQLLEHQPAAASLEEDEASQCFAISECLLPLGSALSDESALAACKVQGLQQLVFKGAFPAGFARRFLEKTKNLRGLKLVACDGTRFLLTSRQFQEFMRRGAEFSVARSANLLAITINPVSPTGGTLDSAELQKELAQLTGLPVFDLAGEVQELKNGI